MGEDEVCRMHTRCGSATAALLVFGVALLGAVEDVLGELDSARVTVHVVLEDGEGEAAEVVGQDGACERQRQVLTSGAECDRSEVDLRELAEAFRGPARSVSAGPRLVHAETARRFDVCGIAWSQLPDLNRRPAVYETAALPTELSWRGRDGSIRALAGESSRP
jgi:hypothetical protein